MAIELPFETHTIYVTIDDEKVYVLKNDFTKVEVPRIEVASKENPIWTIRR